MEEQQIKRSGRSWDFIVLIIVLAFLYLVSQPKVTEVEGGREVTFGAKTPPLFTDRAGNEVEWQNGTYPLYK